jgi:hypothetical protein
MARDDASQLADRRGFRLPAGGGRVPLGGEGASLGALDLWDDGQGLEPSARRALSDLARILSLPRPRSGAGSRA